MPGPDRNTRNFNRETENAVERSLDKEYKPGRPISYEEIVEDIKKQQEEEEEKKASGKYVSEAKRKIIEEEAWVEHRNKNVEIYSKMRQKPKYGE